MLVHFITLKIEQNQNLLKGFFSVFNILVNIDCVRWNIMFHKFTEPHSWLKYLSLKIWFQMLVLPFTMVVALGK